MHPFIAVQLNQMHIRSLHEQAAKSPAPPGEPRRRGPDPMPHPAPLWKRAARLLGALFATGA